jgi:histidinol dehydrogenase
MRCVLAKIVVQLLTVEQKKYRLPVTSDLLQSAETDKNCFKILVTGDETCVHSYEHKLKNSHYTGKHLHHYNPRKCTKFSTRLK